MKPIKNYILIVDGYRRPSRQRNTAGRYRVGAKAPKEAEKLLREKIGFGSIQVYYECEPDDKLNVPYKMVVKEASVENKHPLHATAPRNKKREKR